MTIQVSGVLRTPLNQISVGTRIRVVSSTNTGSTLECLQGEVVTGSDGSYSFELVNGNHSIEVNIGDEYKMVGSVEISGSSVDTDLITLLS